MATVTNDRELYLMIWFLTALSLALLVLLGIQRAEDGPVAEPTPTFSIPSDSCATDPKPSPCLPEEVTA